VAGAVGEVTEEEVCNKIILYQVRSKSKRVILNDNLLLEFAGGWGGWGGKGKLIKNEFSL